jgi:hypothetical protein
VNTLDLKHLLKRGALLAAANWPIVLMQFVVETTFQVLLAVPIIGAAILVAVLLGADLAELLRGNLRDMFTTIAGTLMSEPVAFVAFVLAFSLTLIGGSLLLFVVKGGTVEVMLAANAAAGPIEGEPLTFEGVRSAARFTLERFMGGCGRLYRSYVVLGILLMVVYAASVGGYAALVVYCYRAMGQAVILGWTMAAIAAAALVVWFTVVNFLYLLIQVAIAVEGVGVVDAARAVARFIRAEFREVAGVFLVVFGLVVAAMLASALAWSGVGLIAFVPLIGIAVVPLQLAALVVRGFAFEYLGITALGAYLTLYAGHARKRGAAVAMPTGSPASARA